MNIRTPLCELAEKYGSDKGPSTHNYTPVYYDLMCGTQESTNKVLEIGVLKGASIKMWVDFFPKAHVYGIDIDRKALALPLGQRFIPIHGDQANEDTWSMAGGDFDYIVDDGSHIPEHRVYTFEENFWRVRLGGYWIIEDTHCMFHTEFNPSLDTFLYKWFFQRIMNQQMGGVEAGNFYKAANTFGKNVDPLTQKIYGIRSYKSIIMVEKA